MDTEFIEGNQDLLDWISPLWTKLNAYHRRKSRQFVVYYNQLTFQQRKAVLIAKAQNGLMRVELVRLKEADNYFAYSVTTITATHEGEIESLYVDEPFRRMGIGKDLMTRSLEWLDRHKVKVKRLAVAGGNEETIDFYQRFGFYPKLTLLEQADQFQRLTPDGTAETKNGTKRPRKKK
jgi:ribosomal protein S18 acetylase RimI-like enzyme